MESNTEYESRFFKKFSIVLFIIFIVLTVAVASVWFEISAVRNVFFLILTLFVIFIYYPFYLIFLMAAICRSIIRRKIDGLNTTVFLILTLLITLQYTGFCFEQMRYVGKNEMIDKALDTFIKMNCVYEYKGKNSIERNVSLNDKQLHDATSECTVSLETLKKEAPQCFTDNRPNRCEGNITYYDSHEQKIVNRNAVVYSYSLYFYGFFNSYPVLFSVWSFLANYDGYFVNGCNKDYCIPCD
jgi:hypothetical protein